MIKEHSVIARSQPISVFVILDGVVKTLHLLRCHKFSIISKYLLYVEMIENLRASNLKFFT
jgi:hypothetical protein